MLKIEEYFLSYLLNEEIQKIFKIGLSNNISVDLGLEYKIYFDRYINPQKDSQYIIYISFLKKSFKILNHIELYETQIKGIVSKILFCFKKPIEDNNYKDYLNECKELSQKLIREVLNLIGYQYDIAAKKYRGLNEITSILTF
jgi:hypothetical protein